MSVIEQHFITLDLMGQVRQLKAYSDPSDFQDFVKFAISSTKCSNFDDVVTFLTGRYKHWVSSGDFESNRGLFENAWTSVTTAALGSTGTIMSSSSSSSKVNRSPAKASSHNSSRVIAVGDDDNDEVVVIKDDDDEPLGKKLSSSPPKRAKKDFEGSGSISVVKSKARVDSNANIASSSITNTEGVVDDHTAVMSNTSIPIVIKPTSWDKNTVVCVCNDSELSFEGDLGAVGRIISSKDSFSLDIKGRQYDATMLSGPTILIINLAPPVAQQKTSHLTARVETLTNEHCNLQFVSDTIGNISGNIVGELEGDDSDDDRGDNSNPKKKKSNKKRKTGDDEDDKDDDDDDDDASAYGDNDSDIEEIVKKKKAPKISTITNRSRVKDSKKGKAKKTKKQKKN